MIKKQLERVKRKIGNQVHAVFGVERRKNSSERLFIEKIFREQTVTKDREVAVTLITITIRALNKERIMFGDDALRHILDNGVKD